MTPKEKAEDIIEIFYQELHDVLDVNNAFSYCKQCALIAADEVMKDPTTVLVTHRKEYWQQVKTEIENL